MSSLLRRPILLITLAASLALPLAARAETVVDLNVPTSDITGLSGVVTARARLSRAGSVDQLLYKQPDPLGYPAADTVGFSDSTFIGSVTYDFAVRHFAASSGTGGRIDFSLGCGGKPSGGVIGLIALIESRAQCASAQVVVR